MLSVAVRGGEVLALLAITGILVLTVAAALASWLRRRLQRLLVDHARALLVWIGLPASAEVLARRPLRMASWRRTLARAAWRAMTCRVSRSNRVIPDSRQDAWLTAQR
jgi:hypothetical protein